MNLRLAAVTVAILAAAGGYLLGAAIGPRAQGAAGIICFIAIVMACSSNLRAVNWRTVAWGFALQWALALLILKFEVGGVRPGYAFFSAVGNGVKKFLEFTNAGSGFVFGPLADGQAMAKVFPNGFVFAFTALPTIIFVSSFFTVLYYFGILQFIVRLMAKTMMYLMQTSGAETLSAAANVFMGQTEAPIIVKPYVPGMTKSELLAMMVGGMATISGGVMAVYISLGADPIAILTTSVMAAPCGLYLSKILLPELEEPVTRGEVRVAVEKQHVNVIDAAAAGASDGTILAINVAAMLIAFLAFIALFDFLLGTVRPGLSLAQVFAWVFAPVAILMGVPAADVPGVADLLGTKLVANEFVAYVKLTSQYRDVISPRSYTLATYALTGFANLGSIGIQLGGIGGMAPTRRGDLARLGTRALLAGFLATLINASIAAMLI
ncbi:MAG: Na+ dependent nucleoside transporter domain protein [Acidobacteria bacterium]|nr:Na+ dependent nucleoside transporter domain protein [Acidobacteriota bacterium]